MSLGLGPCFHKVCVLKLAFVLLNLYRRKVSGASPLRLRTEMLDCANTKYEEVMLFSIYMDFARISPSFLCKVEGMILGKSCIGIMLITFYQNDAFLF